MKSNAFAWFCTRHRLLSKILIVYPTIAAIIVCGRLVGIHIAISAVAAFVIGMLFSIVITSAPTALMREPIERYNNGDPYPLLQITWEISKCKIIEPHLLLVKINRCAALSAIGEHERVIEELTNLNIEANPRATIYVKYVYYNNLSDAYFSVKELDKGEIWYQKAAQLFGAMREGKIKESCRTTFAFLTAQYHTLKGEYNRALELLCGIKTKTDREKVAIAYCSAEAHIGLGDNEQAKKDLMFVVSYNKNIYIVKRAQELLDELNKDSAKNCQPVENQQ